MSVAIIDSNHIMKRIEDWEKRVNELMKNIVEWARGHPEWQIEQGNMIQREEHLMKKYGVPPRSLPTLNMYNRGRRISIVPSALWIVGANGRVNMITNSSLYILVDRGGEEGNPSDWHYSTPDTKPHTKPFDKEAFVKILDEN